MQEARTIFAGEDTSGATADVRGRLRIELGICCEQGRREENQDFTEARIPSGSDLDVRGITAVVADGMAGAMGGRVAAELAVRHFIDFYYQMPETFLRHLAVPFRWQQIHRAP